MSAMTRKSPARTRVLIGTLALALLVPAAGCTGAGTAQQPAGQADQSAGQTATGQDRAENQAFYGQISASDGTYDYFYSCDESAICRASMSAPTAGVVVPLSASQSTPEYVTFLLTHGDWLYFVREGDASSAGIWRARKDGSEAQLLRGLGGVAVRPTCMAVVEGRLYAAVPRTDDAGEKYLEAFSMSLEDLSWRDEQVVEGASSAGTAFFSPTGELVLGDAAAADANDSGSSVVANGQTVAFVKDESFDPEESPSEFELRWSLQATPVDGGEPTVLLPEYYAEWPQVNVVGDHYVVYDAGRQMPAIGGDVTAVSADGSTTVTYAGTSPEEKAQEIADWQALHGASADELYAQMDIVQDFHDEFDHGEKNAEHQRYIMVHDTEGEGRPEDIVSWWASNGNLVAAHFVIGKDGHIVQCVPLDRIAHHAGYGNTGHNDAFGIAEDGRDDMAGAVPIGSEYADYGMNAYSVGIELVHVGGSGDYPQEQLDALDDLIAYIDAYYGTECPIIDHKAWRTTNSDTSPEFAGYLANYQDHRTHD